MDLSQWEVIDWFMMALAVCAALLVLGLIAMALHGLYVWFDVRGRPEQSLPATVLSKHFEPETSGVRPQSIVTPGANGLTSVSTVLMPYTDPAVYQVSVSFKGETTMADVPPALFDRLSVRSPVVIKYRTGRFSGVARLDSVEAPE